MFYDYSFTAMAEQNLDGIIKYISGDLSNETVAQCSLFARAKREKVLAI